MTGKLTKLAVAAVLIASLGAIGLVAADLDRDTWHELENEPVEVDNETATVLADLEPDDTLEDDEETETSLAVDNATGDERINDSVTLEVNRSTLGHLSKIEPEANEPGV